MQNKVEKSSLIDLINNSNYKTVEFKPYLHKNSKTKNKYVSCLG